MAPGSRWMDFNYDAYGMGIQPDGSDWQRGFGFKDLEAAQRMGYSNPQIRILAERAVQQGRPVGQKMWDWVHKNAGPGPWDYAGHGGAEFGLADLNAALGRGDDYNKIKTYTDYARQHGIGVGQKAEEWMWRQEDIQRDNLRIEEDRAHQATLAQQAIDSANERSRLERESAAANALKIAEAQAAHTAMLEEQQRRARAIKTSSPLATGSTGSFRAQGLTESKNKRGGGTSQFRSTSPYFQSTLNTTGSGKKTTAKSTLNI